MSKYTQAALRRAKGQLFMQKHGNKILTVAIVAGFYIFMMLAGGVAPWQVS